MIDVSKIYLAQTPEEVLAITQTSNFVDAEKVAIEVYDQSYRTLKSIIFRIIYACIGLLSLLLGLLMPPLFLVGIFFLVYSFFGRMIGKKQLRKKITELQSLAKKLDDYPELFFGKNVADYFPKSVFGSRSTGINDTVNLFFNLDKSKHMWSTAGFCRVDTRRGELQDYYVFSYQFHGSVPQVLLLNKQDQFLPISSPNNRVLTDNVSLWSCIVADQYEIEALAIFTEDIVLKLIEKSTHGPACTFEILDSTLLCFIPFDSPNVKELFVYEKTADTFASILLPQLEKATMATIGNIPPVLSVDLREEEIQYTDLSEDEKKRQKWMVVIAISTFIIGGATINLSAKGVVSPWVISLVIFISFFLIVLLMPKRIRKQWMNGSGLRVNGRSVRIIKEIK